MALRDPQWKGRRAGQRAGRGHQQLLDSDDWIDLQTSTIVAVWESRPGGARFGVGKASFGLLRTDRGSLVAALPGTVAGIPYYVKLVISTDYVAVTPEEGVDIMCTTGGMHQARKLFPELASTWQPATPPGRQL